jgi:hypothetical protein
MVTFLGFGGLAGTRERAVAAEATNSVRERYMVFYCEISMIYEVIEVYSMKIHILSSRLT